MKITISKRFWGMDGAQYGQLEDGTMVRRDCITWFRLDNGLPILDTVVYAN